MNGQQMKTEIGITNAIIRMKFKASGAMVTL